MSNNWENRQYINLGPKFRIESNNPQVGFHGPGVYDIYGNNDQGDVSLMGMTEGGTFRLYNDKSIEIIGGQNCERGGVDICITGMKGSILITAMENGDVRILGNNIVMEAKTDITFKAGANVLFDVGDKFDIKAKEAYCDAPHSYGPDCIATETNKKTFLNQAYAGLAAEDIAIAASAAAGGPGSEIASAVAGAGIAALNWQDGADLSLFSGPRKLDNNAEPRRYLPAGWPNIKNENKTYLGSAVNAAGQDALLEDDGGEFELL